MNSIKSANFSKVVIIQSLEKGRTGNRLKDDLGILTVFTDGIVTSELIDVLNKEQFLSTLLNIKQDVQVGKYNPIIHIEAHGNDDNSGLILASNEAIAWQEMKRPLSEINIATRLNLIMCISACNGGALVSALDTTDRAPCWALVGPKEEMYSDDLLRSFTGFYEEIFKTKSGGNAIRRLNNGLTGNEAKYYFTTAEQFFEIVWINYLQKLCTNDELNKRANDILKKLRKKKSKHIPSRNEIKNDLLRRHPEYFIKSKEHFFMIDLFDDNRSRFSVDYEMVLQKSKDAQRHHALDLQGRAAVA